jgi:hypothetical protein
MTSNKRGRDEFEQMGSDGLQTTGVNWRLVSFIPSSSSLGLHFPLKSGEE